MYTQLVDLVSVVAGIAVVAVLLVVVVVVTVVAKNHHNHHQEGYLHFQKPKKHVLQLLKDLHDIVVDVLVIDFHVNDH